MRYVVRPMNVTDIPRVVEIERLAFTTPWPPSSYRKELQENRYANYIVARDSWLTPTRAPEPPRRFPLSLLPLKPVPPQEGDSDAVIGFAGLWLMIDDAHITIIASHPDYRGHGVGELLLSSLIGIAYEIGARMVSLEVRVSNTVAQNLYHKYGFRQNGIRRRYYSDNHEDALIMVTDDIFSAAYRERYVNLRAALDDRFLRDESAASVSSAADSSRRSVPRTGPLGNVGNG